ncbi:MAG TPA: AAA family ATPase [Terriglobales bacterium]|jgi:general secretion pathway protein A|nr:AAA family ATPase [Terriglobales bacterium]
MYKSFYKLRRNPFEITPDPSFLFPTSRHKEALAALYYGVRRHKGFVVLTGEVGTGKTLLVRWLLQLLRGPDISYAYVFNSRLSSLEFLQFIAGDFGLPTSAKTKSELLLEFGRFLTTRHQQKLTTVLVVDEAHHLSTEVLEEIRLLTNLETEEGKLLQILLIGQPELDEKLDLLELRQLKQRIALRALLGPLDLEETKGYIERRLQLASASSAAVDLFPDETVAEIYRHSKGIPRLINTICENALITAYARQLMTIPIDIINEVAKDFRLNVTQRPEAEKVTSHDNREDEPANNLLQLYKYPRNSRSKEQQVPSASTPGASKHEPYI